MRGYFTVAPCMKGDHAVSGRQGSSARAGEPVDSKLVRYLSMVDAIVLDKMRIFLMET